MTRQKTLDEIEELARNGGLEAYLDSIGVPKASESTPAMTKKPIRSGKSFDRRTFDYDAYLKTLEEEK